MSEWRETTLGDVAGINPEKTPRWASDHMIRYVDIASVSWARGVDAAAAANEIPFGEAPGRARRVVRSKDVLVSTVRPNLRAVAKVPFELDGEVASTGFAVVRAGDEIDPGFIWCLVSDERFTEEMVGRATGSNYPAVRGADVAAFPIQLPPLDEQRRIVDVVAAVDAQIEALGLEVGEARRTATRMRSHLFAGLDCTMVPAGEMFDMLLGRQKSDRQAVGDYVLPYLRSGNVSPGTLALSDVLTMNFEPHEQVKYGLSPGDIMLTEGGTPGQAARWNGEIDGVVGFDKHVIRLRARPEKSMSEYALQWCHWSRETGAFDAQATGITIKALGFGRASAMPIPALDVEEQAALVAPLAALDGVTASTIAELDRLRAFRSTLLTALLSQSISIPESYDALLDASLSALEGAPA